MKRRIRRELLAFVQSRYKSPWRGVIVGYRGIPYRDGQHQVVKVLLCYDKNGNRAPRKVVKELDPAWLKLVPPMDISWVQGDWILGN